MRIAIIGCGAMGSIYAGLLASAGNAVLAIDTNRAHVDAINAGGLRITGRSGDRRVSIRAFTTAPAATVDLVVLAVKAAHVADAARTAQALIGPATLVLTIQNGLGSADVAAEVLGHDRLMVGVAQGFGASRPEPGHAHHNDMKAIRMGAYRDLAHAEVERIASVWRAAGFDAGAVVDIAAMQWEKLICNVAYSAPCALTGMNLGEVMVDPEIGPISRAAATEAWQVARALGIALDFTDPVAHVRAFAARMPLAKPSVLQDVEAGRESEVAFINGAVPREAAKVGLLAPINATLTALVRVLERPGDRTASDSVPTDVVQDHEQAVLAADARRRAAMVAGDADALRGLLGDDLTWTHSSGKTDDKTAFLAGIASGAVIYSALDVPEVAVARHGDVFVCHGTLDGRASRDGVEKTLRNRFLGVWKRRASGFELVAWQSTGIG
jgi:2-dehydropantoate 2-reductase